MRAMYLLVICAVLSMAAAPVLGQPASVAHVETRGAGPVPMVLVPGLSCDWTVWSDFMDRHGERYTMRAVTLPGFGGSEPPPGAADAPGSPWLDHAVEAVARLIRETEGEPPIVVGHSMGAVIAYRLALEHPELIRGAVGVDGPPAIPLGQQSLTEAERRRIVDNVIAPALRAQPASAWAEQQAAQLRAMVRDQDRAGELIEMAKTTPAAVAVRYALELYREDLRNELADVTSPVLAIAALHDDARATGVDADTMRAVWEAQVGPLEGVELVTILDARHFVMDDQPELFDAAVASFVEEVTAP